MRFLGDSHDKPSGAVGRASNQPDSNLSNIRSARDSDRAASGYNTRGQRYRRCRPNVCRDVGAWHDSTLGDSDSGGEPE